MPSPAPCRMVLYRLSASDAADINRRREDFAAGPGHADRTGYVGHVGNEAVEGAVYPAVIVRVWDDSEVTVNLQVHLDGNDHYWAPSRPEGDDVGQWSWPART
ncbi:hypothetical protein ABZ517_05160 [Streptomyces scabiei]|uniref:hypothetical protein n=1 Tax=Streptomyces scabiei TaxID=1930 RepID=UPI0033C81688